MKKSLLHRIRCRFGVSFPKTAMVLNYYRKIHRFPDLANPRTLNEKIQWLKLHGDNRAIARLADKYAVRKYVRDRGLGDMLVPLCGKWDSVAGLRAAWPGLEAPFVLKANNSCQTVLVVKDKEAADLDAVCSTLQEWLSDRTFWGLFVEPHYKYIGPCIIAERYLGPSLTDYKIWCFSGVPQCIFTCSSRTEDSLEIDCFDLDWNEHPERLVFSEHYRRPSSVLPRPEGLQQMLQAAAKLSEGFPQVRVDMYWVDGKAWFGEMTFTSNGGCMPYFTEEYLLELGALCSLT